MVIVVGIYYFLVIVANQHSLWPFLDLATTNIATMPIC